MNSSTSVQARDRDQRDGGSTSDMTARQDSSAVSTRTPPAILPPVDVVEDASGITLWADMPGAQRDQLAIHVDGRTLTLEAPIALGESSQLDATYAEVRANHYRRSFDLSAELDTTSVDAGFKDGVLTLRIPKSEQAKPRRVEIRAG